MHFAENPDSHQEHIQVSPPLHTLSVPHSIVVGINVAHDMFLVGWREVGRIVYPFAESVTIRVPIPMGSLTARVRENIFSPIPALAHAFKGLLEV